MAHWTEAAKSINVFLLAQCGSGNYSVAYDAETDGFSVEATLPCGHTRTGSISRAVWGERMTPPLKDLLEHDC